MQVRRRGSRPRVPNDAKEQWQLRLGLAKESVFNNLHMCARKERQLEPSERKAYHNVRIV
jgi:hypothetical protein